MLVVEQINYVGVVVAAVASFALGFVWYHPKVFGTMWMKMVGLTKKDLDKAAKEGMAKTMGIALVAQITMACVLAQFMYLGGAVGNLQQSLTYAFWLWLGFIATVTLGSVLWERRPVKLWILNASHWLVALLVMAAVINVIN